MSFTLSDDGKFSANLKFSIKKIPGGMTYAVHPVDRVTTCYTPDIEFLTCGNDNITYEQNVLYLNMFLIILNV